MKLATRAAGLLLHISSLPSPYGIGDLGREAYRFLDFLKAAGQSWWQLLPLEPLNDSFSPYQTLSAFAGNPLFIDLDELVSSGLLPSKPEAPANSPTAARVDYPSAAAFKMEYLQQAYTAFRRTGSASLRRAFTQFKQQNADWLEDYALFCALRETHQNRPWTDWPRPLRQRQPDALRTARRDLAPQIEFHTFVQFLFFHQWQRLRRAAHTAGIQILGDIPVFVAHDSSEVWAHQRLFKLDAQGNLKVSAGVPPDYFSATGQRWGNPLYRWDVLKKDNYQWWIRRLAMSFQKYDAIRLDHFIGFYRYWEIPAAAPTAVQGKWQKGPRDDFFQQVFHQLGPVQLVAEDLGSLTPEVESLRDRFNLPGMKVLHFCFNPAPEAEPIRPHHFVPNSVVYTGTHDNNTTVGWLQEPQAAKSKKQSQAMERERQFALDYAGRTGEEAHWDLIRLAYMTPSRLAVVPVQDILGLDASARMNTPGTTTENWRWRLLKKDLTPALAKRLRERAIRYGRAPAAAAPQA